MDIPMYNEYLGLNPSSIAQKPSGRKGSKKVRTGCITCKGRKVKCDEAKPFCLRCIKTGRRCNGYTSPHPASYTDIVLSPDFVKIESPAGRRAFNYYCNRSASLLGGSVDTGFWGGLVLRLSVTEPAVQHSVLALSSLHEAMSPRRDDGRQLSQAFTFSEYGKAITAMRTWDSTKNPLVVPLLVCVLFTCIEFMMGHDTTSQLHICQGRQILACMQESKSPMAGLIKRELVPIYTRLSLASFLFGSQPAPIPHHLRSSISMPTEFASLSEARGYLYHMIDEGLQFTVRGRPVACSLDPDPSKMRGFEAEQRAILSELRQWQNAFAILATKLVPSQLSTITQSLLEMHHHISSIWIAAALSVPERVYDSHTSSFAAIISTSSTIINAQSASFRSATFIFEMELVAPLYWVAWKCRHPLLRRSALRLLRREEVRNRKENLWDARSVAAIAARIIEVEEGDASVDWPHSEWNLGGSLAASSDDSILVCGEHLDMEEAVSTPFSEPPKLPASCISSQDLGSDMAADLLHTSEMQDLNPLHLHQSSPSLQSTIPKRPASPMHTHSFTMEPPYGIPEGRRVQNTVIGSKGPDGVSVTMFKFPAEGQVGWNIRKEFLRV